MLVHHYNFFLFWFFGGTRKHKQEKKRNDWTKITHETNPTSNLWWNDIWTDRTILYELCSLSIPTKFTTIYNNNPQSKQRSSAASTNNRKGNLTVPYTCVLCTTTLASASYKTCRVKKKTRKKKKRKKKSTEARFEVQVFIYAHWTHTCLSLSLFFSATFTNYYDVGKYSSSFRKRRKNTQHYDTTLTFLEPFNFNMYVNINVSGTYKTH